MPLVVVADANVLLASVIGGAAQRALLDARLRVVVPDAQYREVEEHLVELAAKLGLASALLEARLLQLPLEIQPPDVYAGSIANVSDELKRRDPDDAPVAALALALGSPVWSNDNDLRDCAGGMGLQVYTTAELLAMLDRMPDAD